MAKVKKAVKKITKKVKAKVLKPRKVRALPADEKKVLILRTCLPNMTSYNNFKWPVNGFVEAPDFKPTKVCGNGLHGWLWGAGDWSMKYKEPGSLWQVFEVLESEVIQMSDKVKFPRGNVIATCAKWTEAMAIISDRVKKIATNKSEAKEALENLGMGGLVK